MRTDVQADFDWQRQLIPLIKQILANYLITEAPFEEDAHRNTDLIVLRVEALRVACRLRRHQYADRYHGQFTVRSGRPNGTKTELAKIVEGWGDYLFYGFADEHAAGLTAWMLGDLNVFRLWHTTELWHRRSPGEEIPNSDGSSRFRVYNIADLPPEFVIGRSRIPLRKVS